jgi:glyceraldehyde-3-phosphate dehydrogenase (NADP+)
MDRAKQIGSLFPTFDRIPPAVRLETPLRQDVYLVNGELRRWTGPVQDVFSPVCIETAAGLSPYLLGSYPLLSENEALEALHAAEQAYGQGRGPWPTMAVGERIRHMEDFANRMREQRADIVKLLMWEIGKSLPDAEKEFDRTVDYIRDTIEAVKDLDRASSRFTLAEGVIAQIRRGPLGVVLCMGPFNYPLNETFTTLIPALIMGNAVIFKPPRLGVLLHHPLLEAFRDAFPPGVVNTVYGDGAKVVGPLMQSGKIDVLAFIGSSRVADLLRQQHPRPHRLRCVLGLEAKNAGLILPDADLDLTVKECLTGTLSYNGQRCTALKMLFVHEKIVDEFLSRFTAAVETLAPGMPWEEHAQLTPLPEHDKTAYLTELVTEAHKLGARTANPSGGTVNQTFFFPAVVYPVNTHMRLYREEQFGPVIPVASFTDLETPIRYLLESDYGQQVSIFGRDPDTIAQLVDPLVNQVCRVNINSQCQRGPDIFPFAGRKDSAEGTLSVSDALRVFSIRTLVAAKTGELNKHIINTIVRERKSNFLSTDFIL